MSRIAVFVSGNGTHLPFLIQHSNVVAIVCNNPEAPALEKTEGIATCCLDHRDYSTREEWEESIQPFLLEHQVELIVLAGFMRILSPSFIRKWPLKIINVHPSLLPAFPGAHAIQDALDYGAKLSGVTVHFVDAGVDTGPIIYQTVAEIWTDPDETADQVQKRFQVIEGAMLLTAINGFFAGDYKVVGRKTLHKSYKIEGGKVVNSF